MTAAELALVQEALDLLDKSLQAAMKVESQNSAIYNFMNKIDEAVMWGEKMLKVFAAV